MDLGPYWKTIFDTLRDGLIVVDTQGKIIAANPGAEEITGYCADELEGRSCRILNCTGCKFLGEGPGEKWCKMFAVGRTKDKKCLITKKDRRTVHILKSASVLRDAAGEIIGAVETLTDISQIIRQEREIQSLRQTFHLDDGYHGILGKTARMQGLFEMIENVAQSDAPVMITGESGTGKEMVARAVHDAGGRKDKPFIKVNCAALNESLLESELFGHVKGAFTGADRNRIGRFEAAHEGTVFLDEIGDIPHATQVKLLRVLEDKEIEKVGDHYTIPVNVRIITATNRKLEEMVQQGRFREDLFFRINVFPIQCPPLAERIEDVPMLVQHFIRLNGGNSEKRILGITPEALDKLTAYPWPGNIRELRNTIEYAFVLCAGGSIDVGHLPGKISRKIVPPSDASPATVFHGDDSDDDAQRKQFIRSLEQCGWNQSKTARMLGISRVTVWKWMKKYGIQRPG
ncbi:MAG: sigma-54 interaction domain-containing protein [Thermodesulfobacteriota bacterium]